MTSTRLTSVILEHLGQEILVEETPVDGVTVEETPEGVVTVEETPEGVVTVAEGILVAATKSWQDERLRNYNYQIIIKCLDCVM